MGVDSPKYFDMEGFDEAFQKVTAQVSSDLVTCATLLQRLLMAVDLFTLGGLYRGHFAEQAIRRYWLLWMPLLHERQSSKGAAGALIPPLDVQWAWFVHRLNPDKYLRDCTARFGIGVHPTDPQQALGFSSGCPRGQHPQHHREQQPQSQQCGQQDYDYDYADQARGGEYTRRAWEAAYPAGADQPPEHVFWPPAPAPPSRMQQPQPQRQMRCQQPLPPDQCRLQCRRHQQLQQQQQQSQQQSQQQQQPSGSAASTATTAPGEDGEGHGGGCAAEPELRAGGPPPGSSPAGSGSGLPAAAEATGKQPPAAAASDQRADGSAAASGGGGLPPDPGSLESVRSYVADAMVRQGRFLHQILRYFYQDPGFLESGRTRYLRFLALARTQAPDAPLLVPMYDQDIMWHSHMALSGAYVADCGALMPGGRPLGHDDSLSAVSLSDPFAFTMGRYEKATGLMVNPSPSRRIPTFIAQPLVGQLWPLAAALADPRVAELPPPRKIAAELRVGGGGMQHTQTQTQQRRRDDRSGKGGGGGGGGGGSYSRSGVFVGDPDAAALAGPGRAGRPAMLGSPDHLCRSGAFAVYALWCLAERLQLGGSAGDEDEEKEGKEGRRGEGKVGGVVAEEARNAPASGRGGGLGRRLFGGCFPGSTAAGAVEKKEEEGGCDAGPSRAELDAAISHMTQQLLRLTDLNDPTSPLASHRHRFWDDIAPMPPPQPRPPLQSPQQTPPPPPPPPPPPQQRASSSSTPSSSSSDPSVAAAAPYPPFAAAVTAAAGGGASGGCRRRHPAPAPPLDLPCSFLTPSERSAEPTYLAPHHPAVRGQVYYTPSDFCLLGPGRWCLPAPLAAEIAEREAAEADASAAVVYDNRADVKDGHDRRRHRRRHRRRRCWGGCFEGGDDDAVEGGCGDGLRLAGNTLGEIVFSRGWPLRMAECYRHIHRELLLRRGRAATSN